MKKQRKFLPLILILCALNIPMIAQQDYQVVKSFKVKYNEIKKTIDSANSLGTLDTIQAQIDVFKKKYEHNKALLDGSLYPDDFNSSFDKLHHQLVLKREDLSAITNLQVQISQLKVQIDQFNKKNTELMAKIQQLEDKSQKDHKTITALNHKINQLGYSLRKRDRLIMAVLDSLMPASYLETGNLTSKERQHIFSEAKKTDVISNIKRAILDNIKFLQVTALGPKDLEAFKKQENDFEKLWKDVGPAIVDIYSSRRMGVKNLRDIDDEFNRWERAVDQEAWDSIRRTFSDSGIHLEKFTNGVEFTQIIKSYIDDEIKNATRMGDKAEQNYHLFVDSVWYSTIKPNWVPYLRQHKMLTGDQQDTVEAEISAWKGKVTTNWLSWPYLLIAVLVIILIIILIRSSLSKKQKDID